ncbi:MAG: phosphotransferase [Bacteroidota bacterium]
MATPSIPPKLTHLFEKVFGGLPTDCVAVSPAASPRRYFRLSNETYTAIGTLHEDVLENKTFTTFARHFRSLNLSVPEVFAVDEEGKAYLQEDLGDASLLDVWQGRAGHSKAEAISFYAMSLEALARIQVLGIDGLNRQAVIGRPTFDRRAMYWDLCYFKYNYLKLVHAPFDEQKLEEDFDTLLDLLATARTDFFMHRDFQARNIMVTAHGPVIIDFQGGKPGPLAYDVATLLYHARAGLSEEVREELLIHYQEAIQEVLGEVPDNFVKEYEGFALLRALQVLGAYGYRGIFEGKELFKANIPKALLQVQALIEGPLHFLPLPELRRIFTYLIA